MGMEIRRTIRYVHSSGDMAWGRGQGFVMRTQESRTPSPPPPSRTQESAPWPPLWRIMESYPQLLSDNIRIWTSRPFLLGG